MPASIITTTSILTQVRQVESDAPSATGYWGVRIASIFVIFIGSLLGSLTPVILARQRAVHIPGLKHVFFATKYVGSGVIIGTAFMHLLTPAEDSLRDPILEPALHGYDFATAIAMITILVMFFIELSAARLKSLVRTHHHHHHHHDHHHDENHQDRHQHPDSEDGQQDHGSQCQSSSPTIPPSSSAKKTLDHLNHDQTHLEPGCYPNLAAQMTAISILEFGVVLHSIFLGLALALALDDEFIILFIVIIIHQALEGLGLGSRLATLSWPPSRWWVPWLFAALYSVSTPLAIAVGLGVQGSEMMTTSTSLLVNGVLDAISGGILLYTGLVELLAHELMFDEKLRTGPFGVQLLGFGYVCLGAGLMGGLARWV